MRKLITVTILTFAISTSAFATPPTDSSRRGPRPIDRIIRVIKKVIGGGLHLMDDTGTIGVPVPTR